VDPRLLNDDTLALSAVVANCAMNGERQLAGLHGYTRGLWLWRTKWAPAGPT
jgi:hypothetical protein